MSVDWRLWASALGHSIGHDEIEVSLGNERRQRVFVDARQASTALRLWSVILGPAAAAELADGQPLEYAWERNRLSDLVGFSLDTRGRLIGEVWVSVDEVSRDTFALYLSELARVSDWHELRLSGSDQY